MCTIKTLDAVGQVPEAAAQFHAEFGGTEWEVLAVEANYVSLKRDHRRVKLPLDAVLGLPRHQWVDTGLRRTWCKRCDTEGHYIAGSVYSLGGVVCLT